MKVLIFLLLLLPFNIQDKPVTDDCKCKGIPLYGEVMIVDSFADFEVRITDAFEDLTVDSTVTIPRHCGEWVFIKTGTPDFTIELVDSFEDFSIRFEYGGAGINK